MKIQDLTKMNRKAKKNHLIQKKGQKFGVSYPSTTDSTNRLRENPNINQIIHVSKLSS